MSQIDDFSNDDPTLGPRLNLAKWRKLPVQLMGVGGLVTLIGLIVSASRPGPDRFVDFGYSWLVAFMFFLSLGLGALFLVIVHHLFDAGWTVPIRRTYEHIACLLFPALFILWLPIGLLAPKIFAWMGPQLQANPDHALHAKHPMFTYPGFYIVSAICFGASE